MARTIRLTATITPEDDWYVARCVDVEVASQGRTIDEALMNLREALELYFEDEPVPEGQNGPIVAPVDVRLSPRESAEALRRIRTPNRQGAGEGRVPSRWHAGKSLQASA